jgi:hypothetical protein
VPRRSPSGSGGVPAVKWVAQLPLAWKTWAVLRMWIGLLAGTAILLGGPPASSGGPSSVPTLKVMSFNIFYGGDELNLRTRQF